MFDLFSDASDVASDFSASVYFRKAIEWLMELAIVRGNDCRKSASEKFGSSSLMPGTCDAARDDFRMILPCCNVTPLRRRCALPTILLPDDMHDVVRVLSQETEKRFGWGARVGDHRVGDRRAGIHRIELTPQLTWHT